MLLWISRTSTLIHFNPMCSFRSYWALWLTLTSIWGLDRFCAIGNSVRVSTLVSVVTLCLLTRLHSIGESLRGAFIAEFYFLSIQMTMQLPSSHSLPICRRCGPCWASQRRVLSLLVGYYLKIESLVCFFGANFLELNIDKTKQSFEHQDQSL